MNMARKAPLNSENLPDLSLIEFASFIAMKPLGGLSANKAAWTFAKSWIRVKSFWLTWVG